MIISAVFIHTWMTSSIGELYPSWMILSMRFVISKQHFIDANRAWVPSNSNGYKQIDLCILQCMGHCLQLMTSVLFHMIPGDNYYFTEIASEQSDLSEAILLCTAFHSSAQHMDQQSREMSTSWLRSHVLHMVCRNGCTPLYTGYMLHCCRWK